MGFLGSILSEALSSGIKKGLGNAIGKAVESIVKPSVDNLAKKHADQINAATEALEQSRKELDEATSPSSDMVDTNVAEGYEEVKAQFGQKLPQYPMWTVGGTDFELEYRGDMEGYPSYTLKLRGPAVLLDAYKLLIFQAGFNYSGGRYSDVMSKVIDGVCYCFTTTDAIQDDNIWVNYFVCSEYLPDKK